MCYANINTLFFFRLHLLQYGNAPNSEKMVNLQYNSPINLYSSDNVAKALIP